MHLATIRFPRCRQTNLPPPPPPPPPPPWSVMIVITTRRSMFKSLTTKDYELNTDRYISDLLKRHNVGIVGDSEEPVELTS